VEDELAQLANMLLQTKADLMSVNLPGSASVLV
jgi:hypothetical protein